MVDFPLNGDLHDRVGNEISDEIHVIDDKVFFMNIHRLQFLPFLSKSWNSSVTCSKNKLDFKDPYYSITTY